jgi:Protein of unknown function (DUF3096)
LGSGRSRWHAACSTRLARSRYRQNFSLFFEQTSMNLNLSIGPLISLIAGILILAMPKLLNYIVAVYLIIIGLIGLFGISGVALR